MAQSQNNVSKVYKNVIEEVIKNVREAFLNDGVDEQVLQELKQIWESKVTQSGAVAVPEPKQSLQRQITKDPQVLLSQTPPMVGNNQQHQLNVVRKNTPIAAQPAIASTPPITGNQQNQHFISAARPYIANIQQPHAQYTQVMLPAATLTSIQQQQQIPETSQANQQPLRQAYHGLTVSAIQPTRQTIQHNVQGQHIVTTPQLVTTQQQHVTVQQQHVTTQQQQHVTAQPQHVTTQQQHVTTQQQRVAVPQQASRPSVIIQVDGPNDSDSDDDEDDDDDDNDLSHDEDGEDKPQEDSEPLNSDDDVSDDDSSELFETENVVVCQFDRITRSKNKWKFHLKDGIMNLNSNDYVFTKANGEAEW
ncbi:transcription initiation factor IIA subunit 1-like [Dendronephthya gigantea]|uniref:transcription initiation factor IIA subunit 1-like n=1 Tax=Dendronephthya gigantea TaxID=151771 RepID=UPI001069B2FD|nr:transcription initiation factor IIA subunit 1-like [Dendronephthya gigantea]